MLLLYSSKLRINFLEGPDILTEFAIHICIVERDTDTDTEIEYAEIVRTEIIYIDNYGSGYHAANCKQTFNFFVLQMLRKGHHSLTKFLHVILRL